MRAIEIDNLSFKYENRLAPALDRVSLNISDGEFLLLAGASGSGKSTLLKCINGLIPHRYLGDYSGEVRIKDKPVAASQLLEISLIIGTVLQEAEKQLVSSSVQDDVAFGPCNLALPRAEIERRIEHSLGSMGISPLRQRSIFALSGGQKQRLAIAGVLAMEPQIILFDEPLANLDSNGIRLMLEVFAELRGKGKTIIVAEHRTEEVIRANPGRVVVVDKGSIVADDSDPEVLVDFAHILKTPAEYALKNRLPAEKRSLEIESLVAQKLRPLPTRAETTAKTGMELIRVEDVSFEYSGGVRALDHVNFEIYEGERIALLGNNGAGKSTVALNLGGLLKPTEGRVLVRGTDTSLMSVSEIATNVAIVFQNPFSMLFAKTVQDELSFGPKNIGVQPAVISRLIPHVAKQCTVDHLLDKSPFASSFGEKKRICVGSVLTMQPKCVILDEPTSGQDYRSYSEFMGFIRSLSEQGHTLILITHDTDLAVEYTDRTIIMNNGRVVADGATKTILADPKMLEDNAIRETSLLEISRKITHGETVLSLAELLNALPDAHTAGLG